MYLTPLVLASLLAAGTLSTLVSLEVVEKGKKKQKTSPVNLVITLHLSSRCNLTSDSFYHYNCSWLAAGFHWLLLVGL